MAVAMPIYASTGSKWKALKWCLLSRWEIIWEGSIKINLLLIFKNSLCEPAAAIIFGIAFNSYLTHQIIQILNAVVAGNILLFT